MLRRLPRFAHDLHMAPADVWALTLDEWVVLAAAVDSIDEQAKAVAARAR